MQDFQILIVGLIWLNFECLLFLVLNFFVVLFSVVVDLSGQ